MNQENKCLWVLLHEPKGPLVPYLDAFAQSLIDHGFKTHLIGRQIRVVSYFSQWLLDKDVVAEDVDEQQVQCFFAGRAQQQSIRSGDHAVLERLVECLRQMNIIGPHPVDNTPTPIQHAISAFATYLRDERELCDKTRIQYCPVVEQFLSERFGQGKLEFTALRAGDIIGFITRQAKHLSPARAKVATTALRSYLKYLRYCNKIQLDLSSAVPTVPNWSMTGIPRAIAPDHLQAIFTHCPRDTPIGRRDYAILMLLTHLGLRAGEIVSLNLGSIDWEVGSIAITGKGNQATSLPLPTEVGEAIVDYLRHGRPINSSRALFLRACAPIRGLGAQQTIGTIVATAIKRAGIDTPHRGTHQFRHALAADMLRHGATLTEIGSVLRHRHAKTTSLYAKVDFAALRPLCLPWPGGAQ